MTSLNDMIRELRQHPPMQSRNIVGRALVASQVFVVALTLISTSRGADTHARNLPGWRLVWADEFDTNGLPDKAKWRYEIGFVRNNELQFYTQDRLENARVENGMLI